MDRSWRVSSADFKDLKPIRRLTGRFFTLVVSKFPTRSDDAAHIKVAVVVSKKVASKAIDRNRLRRRAKAVLREALVAAEQPVAYVFQAKRGAAEVQFAELRGELLTLVAQARAVDVR